ncbi:MAG: [protein-PII] uridylyltransferase [Myxococcota bacterium]|jgi:[protein-PII] uridylyltransferase|nr:[protein-PII] uridylyltransferase [Myxococcota bacterium]
MSAAPDVEQILPELRLCGPEPERALPSRVKQYIAAVREYLTSLHYEEASGIDVIHMHSDLTDRLVRRLFQLAEESLLADGGELETGVCVVAVGGYARREMNVHSDVDLLVVYEGELTPYVAAIAERLQYWMWDAGLQVGCATRTPSQTVDLGREDNTVRTAVLNARFLCGDGEFFHEFSDTIRRELLPDVAEFIEEQVRVVEERHARYGESAFLLQPNIKEGVGGLRDYHAAFWVARAAQPTSRDLEDFLHFGLLTESEMEDYRAALNFLWRVRNALHIETGRYNDQISFEQQERIAEALGYGTLHGSGPELSVERFMRDYYRHVRNIENFSELVMEQCRARVTKDSGVERVVTAEVDGFRVVDGHVEIPHVQHLRANPVRLFTVFSVAQTYEAPLSRMARRMIRENLDLVDDDFRAAPESREAFLSILSGENRVMRSLVTMNEEGLLAAFLPEWEHIVCRWQHVIYHTYTVDIHSIFLVEELRRLSRGKYEKALPKLTELMHDVVDHEALYLGCLLHDIGKGFGGDHSNKGIPRARACVERLGLDPERTERVLFLVQHHLLMSHLAQSRDLSDPKVILDFAQICGDRRNLRALYLLTFADMRASSVEAWTEWKGHLLAELFDRTAELLESGPSSGRLEKAMELIEGRVEARRSGARSELKNLGFSDERIDGYFDVMPRRYFIAHTPRQIARHAKVVIRHSGGEPLATSYREMRGGFTEFVLCVQDVPGLYSEVAGVLTACRFDILGSHVYTSSAGFALEIYRVATPDGGRDERELAWRTVENALGDVLHGDKSAADLLTDRRPLRKKAPIRKFAPKVLITNEESEFYTLVDVTSDDRRGLLYDLTSVIARHGCSIYISKVGTVLDQVKDTFYIKDDRLKKITGSEALASLERELRCAADPDEEVAVG